MDIKKATLKTKNRQLKSLKSRGACETRTRHLDTASVAL